MKATRINSEHAKEVINNVKSVIRLGGFETGLRTNLNKAIKLCNGSYFTTYSSPEYLFKKEYQLEMKARFTNFLNESYEIWFEESKIYIFENEGENFLIVTRLGYCNVYSLIEKDESEKFEDQPCMIYNGDSKKAVLDYNDKKIELTCTLSNTKVCRWDSKYSESRNHYIVKFKYGKSSGKFDFFDSLNNFETGQTDKTEIDIFEMFYIFLSDCQMAAGCYSFEDFQAESGGTKEGYNACKRALQKFERVFCSSGIDLYDLASYMQEKYNF